MVPEALRIWTWLKFVVKGREKGREKGRSPSGVN